MEWYVLNYDFNKKTAYDFNIFNSVRFNEGLDSLMQEYEGMGMTEKEFLDRLDIILKSAFWSQCEYEIYVTDGFHSENETKRDVYSQVKPNIEILARYIIENYEFKEN